jgi:predicted metal-binding membrane protein
MGVALPLLLLLWVTMMAAMMLPSVAPVAITWVRGIGRQSSGWTRTVRTIEFVGGYLLAWSAFGRLVHAALALTGGLVDDHPTAGRWIGHFRVPTDGLPLRRERPGAEVLSHRHDLGGQRCCGVC